MKITIRTLLCTGLLAVFGSTVAMGATILPPPGLAPGTHYQLAFVTRDLFTAFSTSISDYNTIVSNQAALSPTLAAFDAANGVTWKVIGSTSTTSANVNAASTGLVYTVTGVKVANTGVYGGSLVSPINIDQFGNTLSDVVWTGSNTAGGAAGGINNLGQTFPEHGLSNSTNGSWIADSASIAVSDNPESFYALSSVITVPGVAGVPEPGTATLLGSAFLLGIAGLQWRRSRA